MQQPLKLRSRIFVGVRDVSIVVSGHTRPRAKALGFDGLGLKWDRDRQEWHGPLSLKNLAILERWPEVELSAEAKQAMESFREAAAKRDSYYAARAA